MNFIYPYSFAQYYELVHDYMSGYYKFILFVLYMSVKNLRVKRDFVSKEF